MTVVIVLCRQHLDAFCSSGDFRYCVVVPLRILWRCESLLGITKTFSGVYTDCTCFTDGSISEGMLLLF